MTEAANVKKTILAASRLAMRLLRNNRGQFYTMDGVKAICAAMARGDIAGAKAAVRRLRMVRAGLEAEGASDTIGIYTITITQEMVGMKAGLFLAAEIKKDGWLRPTDEREEKQANFIAQVNKRGGIAFFLANPEDLAKKVAEGLKNLLDAPR